MKNEFLLVHCEGCNGYYEIRYSRNKTTLFFRLNMSACAKCGTLHNEHFVKHFVRSWKCSTCRLPEPFVVRKTEEECDACYTFRRRSEERLLKIGISHNKNNEEKHSRR